MDQRRLDQGVALAAAAHQRLLATLDAWDVDPRRPSLLPHWTVGHVLTHLARNADGNIRMLDGLEMYEGGRDGRAAEIEAGAGRPLAELVDDVRASIWRLEQRWAVQGDWDGTALSIAGEAAFDDLPFRRCREVEVHHADLGAGYTFADFPVEYLRLELRRMEMLWTARQPMGLTGLPAAALAADEPTRLAWLMGRTEIDGIEPARVF